jgi:cell division protein FtsW
LVIIFLLLGLVLVYEASVVEAVTNFNDKTHFVKLQLQWAVLGLIACGITTFLPVKYLKKYAPAFFGVSLILLVLVLLPGFGNRLLGAKRWFHLGGISVQPSEIIKLTLIIYFSALFEHKPKPMQFLFTIGIISGLIMLQPDLGTTMVITMIAFILYYLSQAPLKHIFSIMVTGILAILGLIMSSTYRRQRLLTFLNPDQDPLGASYHIRQIIISLGSGGWFGTGFGRSLQKYTFLPEATTDSIFAVFAEETGFFGTIILISLFTLFAYQGFKVAQKQKDRFSYMLAVGLTLLIVVQALLNLSAMASLVPLTGITLPFISYGGSSLVITLASFGLLLNLSRNN